MQTNQRFADELRDSMAAAAMVTRTVALESYGAGAAVVDDVAAAVVSPYAPQTYDAVWSIALSLRDAEAKWRLAAMQRTKPGRPNTTTLADFHYQRTDMTAEFQRRLEHLSFMGVSVSSYAFHFLLNIYST